MKQWGVRYRRGQKTWPGANPAAAMKRPFNSGAQSTPPTNKRARQQQYSAGGGGGGGSFQQSYGSGDGRGGAGGGYGRSQQGMRAGMQQSLGGLANNASSTVDLLLGLTKILG